MENLNSWTNVLEKINVMLPSLSNSLGVFYDETDCFRSKPSKVGKSIVSLAMAIEVIMDLQLINKTNYSSHDQLKKQFKILLTEDWVFGDRPKEEFYPISLTLPSFTKLFKYLKKNNLIEEDGFIEKLLERQKLLYKVINENQDEKWMDKEPTGNALFLYRLRSALECIKTEWFDTLVEYSKGDKVQLKNDLDAKIEYLSSIMQNRLFYALSMCHAIPNNEEHAFELGYLIYSLYTFDGFKNDVIIDHTIQLIIDTLYGDGRFPRIQTIYRAPKVNVSASPIELLTLLSRLPHVRRQFNRLYHAYNDTYEWLNTTQRSFRYNKQDETIWLAEPWRKTEEPEAWVNIQVIEFLYSYKELLRNVCNDQLLVELRAKTSEPKFTWDEVILGKDIKNEIDNGFINIIKSDINMNKPLSKGSMILFGPPGSSKTTIAQAIAWELGWPFIEISPYNFAEDGVESVIRRAREIFSKLMVLKKCVVLFDEIDELVTSREQDEEKIGRFITASVLPWFQQLRDASDIVFIAATNHINHFDPAIKRPGRFDYVLPISPLSPDQQRDLLKKLFDKFNVDKFKIPPKEHLISDILNFSIQTLSDTKYPNLDGSSEDQDWKITIGELKTFAENIERKLGSDNVETCDDIEPFIRKIIDRMVENPLIKKKELEEFLDHAKAYRYPPSLT